MVMRDTSGFSVRPTVSESMLKARLRNKDATRVSTPGLFSTYTTNVFSIGLLVCRGLDDGTRPPDHLVQCCSRRDHGINRVFLLDLKIDQNRTIMLPRCLHRGHNLRALCNGLTSNSVGFCQLLEIRIQKRSCLVIAVIEEFLPLPHHSQVAVVDDGNVHLQIFLYDRGEFR